MSFNASHSAHLPLILYSDSQNQEPDFILQEMDYTSLLVHIPYEAAEKLVSFYISIRTVLLLSRAELLGFLHKTTDCALIGNLRP